MKLRIKNKYFLVSFTLAVVVASFIIANHAVRAIDGPIKGGCSSNSYTSGYRSPFSVTGSQCLGENDSNNNAFQFAVEIPIANSSVSVTAKNNNGTNIPFVKQSDTLYVSQPSPSDDTAGYRGSVPPLTKGTCNKNDGANIINITAKSTDKEQSFLINLCDNVNNFVIGNTANNLTSGDNGAVAAAPTTGCIEGSLGIVRDDPALSSWSLDKINAKLQQKAITYIKIDGPTSHEFSVKNKGADVTSSSVTDWFTIQDGKFTAKNLASGYYTITLKYNDTIMIKEIDPQAVSNTSSEVTFSIPNIGVNTGSTCSQYINGDDVWLSSTTGEQTKPKSDKTGRTTTCAVSSVGWIVCPVMSFLSDLSDKSMSFLEGSFLTTPSSMFVTGDTGNVPLKSAWNTMRSVANVGFIFAFLFIIFSQLTGYGVSNYGVKKMLPRLIVAAILVNLSFYLCALMVDISNILGHTLHTIFNDLNKGLKTTLNQAGNTGWGVGAIVLGLLAGGTSLALAISIPVVISALIAVLATVLALAGRTALIVLLIVISPLAFIAYILPNTEQWFKKWLKMLWTLLLLFPIISIVFGVSKFASSIVYTIGAESDSNISGLVAIAVAALPLFVVPGLLKNALSAAGSIGTKFANLRDHLNKNATSKAANSGVVKSLERRKQLRRARVGAGVYSGWNPVSRLASSANKKLNSNKAFNTLTGDYGTTRGGMIGKLEEEESKTAEAAVVLKARDGNSYQAQLTAAINSGDAVTAKASQSMLVKSGGPGISAVRDIVKTFTADPSRLSADSKKALSSMSTDIMETHGAAVNESAPDLLAWSKDTNNNNSIENLGAITAKPGTWNNKSARQLAKLPDAVFADAINSGGIHSEARKNLNKREIQADLTPAKKELLDNSAAAAAAAAATAAAAAATGATPGGGTGAPGNTGPAGGPAPGGPAPSGPAPSGPTPPAVPRPANGPAPGSPPSNP